VIAVAMGWSMSRRCLVSKSCVWQSLTCRLDRWREHLREREGLRIGLLGVCFRIVLVFLGIAPSASIGRHLVCCTPPFYVCLGFSTKSLTNCRNSTGFSACTQCPLSSVSNRMLGKNSLVVGSFRSVMYLALAPLMNRAGPSHVDSPGA
jgi:hypothetical protein